MVTAWQDYRRIRTAAPLVLNITNYVVMNTTANALLAAGASPIMAHAIEEAEEMACLASALVINIGTLSEPWLASMLKAGKAASARGIPVILDPVGCGATRFRMEAAMKLLQEVRPSIVRGNASEIRALAHAGGRTKGVDSLHSPEEALDDARALSRDADCAVSVSGEVDIIVDGNTTKRVANGHPIMGKVTGMGCTASALTGAFAAVAATRLDAAMGAMAIMGVAGDLSAEKSAGPGSFQVLFLDALHNLDEAAFAARARVTNG